ncbi:outer membrane beta-barrel protein [Brumimicrobium mesophilum]|uniref:outer membrane beta-barrel protein n=1 Tax=Brumimicrobium mesophilum TaxID=392717 RepID=UPI000D142CC5|nr:outer membrane beta-barrel protein [Brumimicrobium mesophilum]
MKKIILTGCLAFSALFVGNVNAQTFADVEKPTDATPFSIETLVGGVYGTGINWTAPALRARYFFDNNIAARLQLGLGDGVSPMSYTERFYENTDGSGQEGTLEINRMAWNIQVGAEYHFLGTQKLDPYAALGINLGGGNREVTGTMYDGMEFNEDVSFTGEGSYSLFGATLGLGMDFYFAENLYVGAELGLGINAFNYKDSEETNSFTAGGATTTVTAVTGGFKESYLGTQGVLRFGWRF